MDAEITAPAQPPSLGPYSWNVTGHNGTVTFSYTEFANVGSGTFSGFNPENDHIQPQGTFVYVKGLEARPIKVTFHRPDPSWTISTQLVPSKSDSETFTAPGLQYFFDSPIHLGKIQWRQWTETHNGLEQTWRVALDDPTGPQAVDAYADGLKKIVHEAGAVFGEFPKFGMPEMPDAQGWWPKLPRLQMPAFSMPQFPDFSSPQLPDVGGDWPQIILAVLLVVGLIVAMRL